MRAMVALISGVLAGFAGYLGVDALASSGLVWYRNELYATEGYDASEAAFSWAGLYFWWILAGVLLLVSIVCSVWEARSHRTNRWFFISLALLTPLLVVIVTAHFWPLKLGVGGAIPIPLD